MNVHDIIDQAVKETIRELKRNKLLKPTRLNSFTRVEKILYLYPKLTIHDPMKQCIDNALSVIKGDEYYGVIESYFFEDLTFEKIADIYDVDTRTVSRNRTRLVKVLAQELFPNEVIKDILED